jgi:integrase
MGKRAYGSGSKREVRPGVWQVRINGRSRTVQGGAKDAERVLSAMAGVSKSTASPTLRALLDEWLASARIEQSTKDTYVVALKHLPDKFAATRIDKLTLRDFDKLYRDLERTVTPHQLHKLHTTLSSALTTAIRWGWLSTHPAKGASLPPLPDRKVTAPTMEQIAKIIAEADRDLVTSVWLRLAVTTGARRGELLALRWSDIDAKAATMTIDESLNEDRTTKRTKTNRVRIIELDADTVDRLRRWKAGQAERALAVGVPLARNGFVLSNAPDSSVPWRPDGVTQRFRRLCARAGVDGVRLHDLRHGMASHMLQQGVDAVTVAGRLGHASTTTTMRVYAHVIPGADRRAAELMASIIAR